MAKNQGRASRQKGKRGELEVVHILKEHGFDARRTQQFAGKAGTADVDGLPGFHVEVKRRERTDIKNWMEQSTNEALEDEIPIVVFRASNEPWRVVMDFEQFLDLLK